jgi:hypothetical protein
MSDSSDDDQSQGESCAAQTPSSRYTGRTASSVELQTPKTLSSSTRGEAQIDAPREIAIPNEDPELSLAERVKSRARASVQSQKQPVRSDRLQAS